MSRSHDKPARRVAEPVQVYLGSADRRTLQRLAEQLDLSMSDVIRHALAAYEQTLLSPEQHPSLRIIGIAGAPGRQAGYDVAVEHDRFLAEAMSEAIVPARKRPRGGKRGG